MFIHFQKSCSDEHVLSIEQALSSKGVRTVRSPETERPILAVIDALKGDAKAAIEADPHVERLIPARGAWRQVDASFRTTPTIVEIGPLKIGPGHPCVVMAGPCSVEGRDAVRAVAKHVKEAGAHMLRGGAFKPRSSPYSFQGYGIEGLRQLKDAGDEFGLPIVTEIMDGAHLDAFIDVGVDCLQIGARNMQNFALLKAIAGAGIPVLLKRGLAATVEEWLFSAEYLLAGGCPDVMLCERGIRTFETATRNTLDLTVLPLLREWTHLPIVVDPAHAAGIASIIPILSRASVAAEADGLTVEVHLDPKNARSDGAQALSPSALKQIVAEARILSSLF